MKTMLVVCVLLAGCVSSEERQQSDFTAAMSMCQRMGATPGPAMQQCVTRLMVTAQQDRQQRIERIQKSLRDASDIIQAGTPPPPAPRPVINCVTTPNGRTTQCY